MERVVFGGGIFSTLAVLCVVAARSPKCVPRPGLSLGPLLFGATAMAIVANTLVETPRESLLGLAFIGLGIPIYRIQRALKRRATSSHES